MKTLNVLIVDDEEPARRKLLSLLRKEERVDSVREAADGEEAVALIREEKPDLVFLDIQMPGMNGFDVIEAVGATRMPAVIFVTAFDRYAIEAFEVQAVDYLLKPYDQARFVKSFDRAFDRIRGGGENAELFLELLQSVKAGSDYAERILVRKGGRRFFVRVEDIMYFSAEEKYVSLHTPEKNYLLRETMGRMEARLDPKRFARIHRSHIVNLDHVKEIQPWSHGDSLVILRNGEKLFLSRRYRDRLF